MGMFDWYEPDPPLVCPLCQTRLVEWQGKDGPCLLFRWKQGRGDPGNQPEWSEYKPQFRDKYRLPKQFELYSYDCENHQPITALGRTIKGIWKTTKIMGHGWFEKRKGRFQWKPYSMMDRNFGMLKGGKKSLAKALLQERRKDRVREDRNAKG